MATRRSASMPSRLRQLLSGEGSIGPSIRLDTEPPAEIKSFIDKVIQSPLADIALPLSGFRWEYSKGNFHHWRPLFLHFDKYFKTFLSTRNDLLLSDNILQDEDSFPKYTVLQILRVMQIILENCPNKSSFDGLEHFKLLLASTDPEVLIAALETLSALVKITSSKLHKSGKLIGCGSVNSFLLSLAQGWGSKEEGLGLYSCLVANERNQDEGLTLFPSDLDNSHNEAASRIGSTVYFELRGQRVDDDGTSATSSSRVIQIPDLHLRKEDDLVLMKECIERFNVPAELRFSLLTRLRYAHAFRSSRTCRLYSRICLLAFIVLVQSSDAQEELASFFANEPEYTNELIRIVRSEEPIPGTIKTLAMLALGAQLAVYSASHDRARILSRSSINFAVGNRMILLNVLQKAVLSLKTSSDPSSIAFVEALLQFYLLHIVSSSSSGSTIRGSGMVPTFLPLLEYTDPTHLHLVYLAVKALQKLMDYSSSAVPLLRDLGGVELLSQRLDVEVHHILKLTGENNTDMVVGGSLESNSDQLRSRKRLIKVLLKSLGSSTYTPGNANRSQSSQESTLPATLSLIYRNADKFGGDIYYSAVTVMSDLIHKDPTSLTSLFEMGLPEAFLSSVVSGILPSSKAIACIPNGLGAISLNSKGLETVKETSALRFLVDVFTSKKYVLAMNEAIVPFTNAVEELLRHVSSLRATGVEIIIEIVDRIAGFGESGSSSSSVNPTESTAMEMDSDVENINAVSHEQFIQLCIFHLIILLHRTMENAETSRLFVEKSGIEAVLKLLLRPSIAQSSEGVSIALHSTIVFKGFTQHHSASLARAFCTSLRDQVKKALKGLQDLSGVFLLDRKLSPSCGIFSSLFLVEFLLFLAASKDNRWMTALLSEFANGSKDVLEDIGHLHREILWHIAVYESATLESPDASPESEQTEVSINGTEGQRFSSFRQFLDPSSQRRTSGWSSESQFFDLINLYRDLGRASTGFQPRAITGGPSSSSDVSGSRELEKDGSYYTSCCDMVKSLSFHISYIFQELGKAMLLQSRRREDTINVSASSKLVASSFASISLDHLNFEGHEIAAEASSSTKCRYLGKVVDFIDAVLLDRPDSCNPVMINCFYGRGVIQTVLTTFDATSQLLFAVNRNHSSLMETDDLKGKQDEKDDTDHAWIYGPLASYGKIMDHLVTSSFILSPFTKHFLVQPVENGNIPFPQDAETFVKILQSIVLKAVLPVWTHPLFTECSYDFVTTLISIIKHVYSGVELKNLGGNGSGRVTGPPPSETTISTIVEMGFSRSRAEEALRQVGSNSVELAMEWLFSHPEEIQEDDELARALAMSLGNSESDTKQNVVDETQEQIEAEVVSLPPVEELITTCTKLLQMKEPLAFPVRDLLVLICSENNGEHRSSVVSYLVSRIKDCCPVFDDSKSNLLSALLHVLALILHEDAGSREVALKAGVIRILCDVLSEWDSGSIDKEKFLVPKWVTTGFLAIDRLLQVDQKLNTELIEELQKGETSLAIDESKQDKLQSVFGSPQLVDVDDQKRLIEIACTCIRNQLPSETMHAVLQLCSTLTRKHSVAICFLDFGGVQGLLSLPSNSLFPGFDSVAASIIRHVLEDPQTLQQAMESEIKHALATLSNRHSNPRISPRNFLLHVNSVIARDPVTFIQAARSICQVEMVGDRPYMVLVKEKEKSKDKEKDKDKTDTKAASKFHRKPPQSFIGVVELLLDSICNFIPPPKDEMVEGDTTVADMDIDLASTKGKGKAVDTTPEEKKANSQDVSASLAKVVFILKLLSEMLLMYSSSIHIILRRDAEINGLRGPQQKSAQAGGIFHHILHKFIPYSRVKKEKKSESDWRQKLASRANQFLVGASVRSAEARKRIFSDMSSIFSDFIDTSNAPKPPVNEIHILIDLLSDMLSARSPTGSHISSEASNTFVDAGLVKSLTRTLEVLDLDNVESPKAVTGILKVLELVTKEHARSADSNSKDENANNSSDQIQAGRGDTTVEAGETMLQSNHDSMTTDHVENFGGSHTYVGSEDVTDDMEHDQGLDGRFAAGEDDYMQEAGEDARGLENRIGSMGIELEMHTHVQENPDEEEDEEMSGDEGDEIGEDENDNEEEDEEDNDLEEEEEEDDVHHLPHHDIDQDDHELDDDEFEEEVLVEEDEEDEDGEDRVILRFEDGVNGLNVLDHLDVLRDHRFSDETLHVMPVEVFGSRRQGRTTSIYSLLGRTGDGATPSQHPLLTGSPSLPVSQSQTESMRDLTVGGRDSHGSSSSRLDAIFRSLRNGRQGNRLNLWADDSQQIVGSGASTVPQGLEDLLVSQLLLNLCSHGETRLSLVNRFMDMLMLDTRKPVNSSSVSEPPYRLYACQSNVTYSRPQHFDGVPPLVSRRVLETLTYLARNHMYVAKILLQSRLSLPSLQGSEPSDKARGKAVVVSDDDNMGRTQQEPESVAFALLLSLLNQPLYLRSVAHLEQLLNLLEVIIDNAERKSESADRSDGSASEQQSTQQALEVENNSENQDIVPGTADTMTKPIVSSGSSSTRAESECDVHSVLLNLPQSELCLLCSLLAREGLSDNAYTLVAEVLKKLVAIAPSHCHLFITELTNGIQNLTRSAMSELHMFGEAVKALLSSTTSDGSAILRVLQALSSLIDSLITKGKNNSEEQVAVFSQLSNINLALEPLWLELSNCICKIEGHSDSSSVATSPSSSSATRGAGVSQSLPAGAQNILPYVESFFVTCEKLHPSSQAGSGNNDTSVPMASSDVEEQPKGGPGPSSSSNSKVDEKYGSFIKFSERHRKLLNAFIRQNPALLEKSFSLMLKVPRFIEFDNKRAYFRSKIKHQHDHHHSPLRISVRRAYILEDSYNQLRMRSMQELKGRLTVHFQGEEGIDAGGLTREWYQLLSRVIFDKGALLFTTVGNDSTFQPNPNSVYQTEHLSYFKFVGRVVGKALFDGQLLDVHFTRSFYKHILGVKVTYHDIEAIDPDYYKALKWMLENDISDVLDLTFSVDADEEKLILYEKTEVTDHELIPGGRNIKVTEENKHEYVDLIAEHRLTTAIRPQINAFLEGFSELILKDLISIFNDKELELLISGLPDIDLDNLRANTEYSGYSPGSPVIQWFWEVVQALSKEDKARLLQFVTGTSKVPLEGFSALQGISGAQKFQIHKAYGSVNHLPSAHTCFNQLDLPEYPSKEHLQERLLLAIHEASEGFGFG
ncbi:unnamed protein product [Eruca vesicaria subsp. sativa]|uniref:HECT-type E3 ubiquitin transferase n=1 Tax=Eruca vesicaria subsp. sativa TaxID=29727 RepID=A0ABC8KDW4_ERUVS|nr:unnamed protein product [Eruca vesicaria subsp. sativa]